MNKDRLIEDMLKNMGDKNNTIDLDAYGRGLIDMYDRLVKNCSTPDVVKRSEHFTPKQLYMLAQRHSIQEFQKILKEAPTWKG